MGGRSKVYHVVGFFFFEDQAEIRTCWLGKKNGENKDPKVMIGTWNKSEMDSWRRIYSTQETKILNSDGILGNLPNGQAKREQNQKLRKLHNNMITLVGFFLYRLSEKIWKIGAFWYFLFWPHFLHILKLGRFKIRNIEPPVTVAFVSNNVLETNVQSKILVTPKKIRLLSPNFKWLQN